jgi:hypothetical protein
LAADQNHLAGRQSELKRTLEFRGQKPLCRRYDKLSKNAITHVTYSTPFFFEYCGGFIKDSRASIERQKTTQVSSIHLSITEIEFDGVANPCDHSALSCRNWQADTKQEYKNKNNGWLKIKKLCAAQGSPAYI